MDYSFSRLFLATCFMFYNVRNAQSVVPAIFSFGDSLLDTGNNNGEYTMARADFYPYGKDFINKTATGRFSNGRVATDLIAEGLGIKQTVPAYRKPDLKPNDLLTGVGFASGGSGLDEFTTKITWSIPMKDQVKDFKAYIAKLNSVTGDKNKTQSIISNALFLICAGNNDIGITYFSGVRFSHNTLSGYTDRLIGWTNSLLKELFGLGARKFAVMGTLPLGCLPSHTSFVGGHCVEIVNSGARMFNGKLVKELNNLNAKLPNARFIYIDMYNTVYDAVQNPKKYGFETGSRSCIARMAKNPVACEDASRYVFFDYVHPTEKTIRVVLDPIMDKLRREFA